eukprot:CAMPEP_0206498430 /NCGR_PEP_ID=MMETSP0324_2-20121206/50982_1 /ASSEMBLY_ACC=CAM_ASM_000836 /TAXON_ID=2866 /ORGANISM="Crypthecodinium cohnii, Strain Seligo" /LENGTH=602 /DNA_ID=CAMNT_0053984601 /DNA_START=117 /DNA_END=1926 /DNA_ORIENTATION=+
MSEEAGDATMLPAAAAGGEVEEHPTTSPDAAEEAAATSGEATGEAGGEGGEAGEAAAEGGDAPAGGDDGAAEASAENVEGGDEVGDGFDEGDPPAAPPEEEDIPPPNPDMAEGPTEGVAPLGEAPVIEIEAAGGTDHHHHHHHPDDDDDDPGPALEAPQQASEAGPNSFGAFSDVEQPLAYEAQVPSLNIVDADATQVPMMDMGTFQDYLATTDIAQDYENACKQSGRKVNVLIRRSLHESIQAGKDTFFLEAPGNHKLVFTCRLGDADMTVFSKVFSPAAYHLQRLDLSHNLLSDDGVRLLAQSLLHNGRGQKLKALSLRSNDIGPSGSAALCEALVQCRSLLRFDISHNPLGRDGGLVVVEYLRHAPSLLELFMQDTEADIVVLVAIAEALWNPQLNLKVCNIENPRIQTLQEDHTVHLGRMLRVNTRLSEIYLGKVKMRDEGVRQLVSFLLENKTLRILDLRCNELGADGAKHLAVLLSSDCQLSHLYLSANKIGEKCNVSGAAALADSLLHNRMLKHLDLNHNSLCGPALKAIADAVEQTSMLESIALFHNQWDQPSSYKFRQILQDHARIIPLKADFITSEVDLRVEVCKAADFSPA